jgi:YgiT-type zinc finger domain-containing protein
MKEQGQRKEKEMHKFGDCSFCGGEVKNDIVEMDYRYKGQLYIFQDVPAGVCQQCGERYLIGKVSKEIERRIQAKNQWKKTISVPVNKFSEKLAV